MGTSALFLHFDEQLTSGLRMPAAYDENDLIFWLHFYSLFFDTIYIPANQLTDATPCTLRALQLGGIAEEGSILRMDGGPVKVLWDESRFPWNSFRQLFAQTSPEADPMWCTARDPEASARAADLCDAAQLQIVRADMTAHLDPKESVAQLRTEVFSARNNSALKPGRLKRLQECLSRIEQRWDGKGNPSVYSRNFYYAVFGYGRTSEMRRLAERFSDIIGDYRPISSHFLIGVDYVSHSLKALFASQALSRLSNTRVNIDIVLPDEYARSVLPPETNGYQIELAAARSSYGVLRPHPILHTIDRDAVVFLKGKQFRELHDSSEYMTYRAAINILREPVSPISEMDTQRAEEALNAYLSRIAVMLKPIKGHFHKGLTVVGRAKYDLLGLAVLLFLGTELPPGRAEQVSKTVETFAKAFNTTARPLPSLSGPPNQLPATFRLGESIKVYLR